MLLDMIKKPVVIFNLALLLLCLITPLLTPYLDGGEFYMSVMARIMIWAIAAISLNLIMGYGGMISFGHAVYIGIGGYVIGVCSYHGIESAYIQWPLALVLSALVSLIFGAICLRTKGVYFIMITLAFAQMIYYLSISIEKYGSDDGLSIDTRSDFGISLLDLNDNNTMYYLIFIIMIGCLYLTYRIVNSRFGFVIRGSKSNDPRMRAVGYPTYGYKLVAFVIAGVICGLSGVLSANFEDFVYPDMMSWQKSGDLIFMVVLGGMGTIFGPLGGAIVFWVLQEFLSTITEKWHLIFGPFLILVVLFARGGLSGFLSGSWRRNG